MKKILITGGSGFIGSGIKVELKKLGFELLSIGRSEREDIKIDLSDEKISDVVKKFAPDIVCHFASGSNIAKANENKEKEYIDTVVSGELLINNLLRLHTPPKKVIYLSSQAVYGVSDYLPASEKHPVKPVSVYGENKLKMENLLIQSGLNYTIFRISSVYGAMQNYIKSGVIANFVYRMKNKQNPIIFNSVDNFCDFIYIDDVVSAIVKGIVNNEVKDEVFNLGTGKPTKLKEVLNYLYDYFPEAPEMKLQTNFIYPTKEQKGLYLDIGKIKSMLKWDYHFSLEDGLKKMLKDIMSLSNKA